jgi:exosortase/archaeosortase family protein
MREFGAHPMARVALVVAAVGVAYSYSLRTLVGTLGADTPLAYLGLAPLIAFGVALILGRPREPASDLRDRNIDYLVAVPLLGTAVLMTAVLPARMSLLFWYYRVDLLSLPLFVAGTVALVFGASTLWRIRYAVLFLLLAWPAPYNFALDHGMGSFTNLTLASLRGLVRLVPVAVPQAGGDGSIFVMHHGAAQFTLSVASACTGVDSFVGFLLVGLAVMTVVDGSIRGRLLWLASGMALAYILNLLRLMVIFWAGTAFGQKVALDGLHPVLGLMLFCAGVGVMVNALRRFHLEVRDVLPRAVRVTWRIPGRLLGVVAAVAAVTAIIAVADGGFGRYSPVASVLGSPRLVSFTDDPIVPAGWTLAPIDQYPWASQYFGSGARWTRYQFSPGSVPGGTTVLADVINTGDLESFTTYDVIACYDYHGYGLSREQRVGLGDGVEGTELTFTVPSLQGQWNALYWVWPVRAGSAVRYERIVLLDPVASGFSVTGYDRLADAPLGTPAGPGSEASRTFLVRFGQSLIRERSGTAEPAA